MSTIMKWLTLVVSWLVFSLLAFNYCVKPTYCPDKAEAAVPAPAPATEVKRAPIDFQWQNATAFTNTGFDALKDRLVSEMADGNKLLITGRYYASETAPAGFASMGLARAEQVKNLLSKFIPADRMITTDLKLDDAESAKTGYFEAADFEWQAENGPEQAEVVELDNNIIIRFPYSSAVKDPDPAVDEYLDKLAERMKQTKERVAITGHTDDRGTNESNMRLSERRAKFVRDILVRKGVDTARITVDWKGEEQPRSSNDTEEGRHNNRRVELQISGN